MWDGGGKTSTEMLTDCPPVADPLSNRVPPAVTSCDHLLKIVLGGNAVLNPGVYCGGLTISGNASVTFNPGVYVIKDGLFLVQHSASIKGEDVAFYMKGAASQLQFFDNATIDLSGAKSGKLAGILFYGDPNALGLVVHNIRSTNAHNLTGTIYMPKANLVVDPAAPVGQNSAYTAIIANRLIVDNGPTLVLNTNYDDTNVPVPEGIRFANDIVLAE